MVHNNFKCEYLIVERKVESNLLELVHILNIFQKIQFGTRSGARTRKSGCVLLKFAVGPKIDPTKQQNEQFLKLCLTPVSYVLIPVV